MTSLCGGGHPPLLLHLFIQGRSSPPFLVASSVRQHDPQPRARFEKLPAEDTYGVVMGVICHEPLNGRCVILRQQRPDMVHRSGTTAGGPA